MTEDKRHIFSYLSLGWEFAIPIFLGVVIGYYLDQLLNTKYLLRITFLICGIAGGYLNLFRTIQRMNKKTPDKKNEQ